MNISDKRISLKPMLFVQITLVVILASMGTAFAVISPDSYSDTVDTPAIQSYSEDTNVEIVQGVISPNAAGASADATGELDPTYSTDTVTTAVTADDYIYEFDFQEVVTTGTVAAAEAYTVKVWVDGTLTATFTINQTAADAGQEGVECTVSCGSTGYPDEIEIHVTKN